MNASELISRRLVNQQIATTDFTTPEQIVSWLVAMQAQEYAVTKWAIGLRLPGATNAAIEKAFNSGTILRTHVMRPTWHFITPPDIRWLLQLTAPRVHALNAYMYRQTELDTKLLTRSMRVLEKALAGKHLTRAALQEALQQKKINASGMRLAYIIMYAELEQLLCSGPREGKQFTYALLEERVPAVAPMRASEALGKFATRYFAGRGPATVADFAYWSGLTLQAAKKGAASLPASFVREKMNESEYIYDPTVLHKKASHQTSFLMPDYDEYGMSYKDRSDIASASPKKILVHNRMIVINGRVEGSWRRTDTGDKATIDTALFAPLSSAGQKALDKAIIKYKAFTSS